MGALSNVCSAAVAAAATASPTAAQQFHVLQQSACVVAVVVVAGVFGAVPPFAEAEVGDHQSWLLLVLLQWQRGPGDYQPWCRSC